MHSVKKFMSIACREVVSSHFQGAGNKMPPVFENLREVTGMEHMNREKVISS